MICCIFGAGALYGCERLPEPPFFSICADGGYEAAQKLGVTPDILIGDFDSLKKESDCKEVIRLKPEKDDTDTLSAVKLALKRGFSDFVFYGCTGGRTDHTIANLQILYELAKRGCRAYLVGNHEIFTCLSNGSVSFSRESQGMFSVFSLSEKSTGVSETGVKYTLDHAEMTNGFPIGVSNEWIGKSAEISVRDGVLLLIYSDQAKETGRTLFTTERRKP